MELNQISLILWRRRLASIAVIALAIGAAVAVKIGSRSSPTGAATVQVLVDSPDSALADLLQEPEPLASRAAVLAQVMTSESVLERIGSFAKVPASKITAQGPYSGAGQTLDVVTPSAARANQLLGEKAPYRLTLVPQLNEPVVTATVQGPNVVAAARLASAVFPAVQTYLNQLEQQTGTPPAHRVTLRQLGPPQAGTVNAGSGTVASAAAGIGLALLGFLLSLLVEGRQQRMRALGELAFAAHSSGDFAAHSNDVPSTSTGPDPATARPSGSNGA